MRPKKRGREKKATKKVNSTGNMKKVTKKRYNKGSKKAEKCV